MTNQFDSDISSFRGALDNLQSCFLRVVAFQAHAKQFVGKTRLLPTALREEAHKNLKEWYLAADQAHIALDGLSPEIVADLDRLGGCVWQPAVRSTLHHILAHSRRFLQRLELHGTLPDWEVDEVRLLRLSKVMMQLQSLVELRMLTDKNLQPLPRDAAGGGAIDVVQPPTDTDLQARPAGVRKRPPEYAGHVKPAASETKPEEASPPPQPVAHSPRVRLFGANAKPLVDGKPKPELTLPQYNVVFALLKAENNALTKDELDKKSGHSEARKILSRLANSDSDWNDVIRLPGKAGRRYRIL